MWRELETDIIPTLEEPDIGLVTDIPLGRGFLGGTIDEHTQLHVSDFLNTLPRFRPEALRANLEVITLLRQVGQTKQATPAQVAPAWLVSRKAWVVPIPGSTGLERVEAILEV